MNAPLLREHLTSIFEAGLEQVNPYTMITNRVRLIDNTLEVDTGNGTQSWDLTPFRRIILVGAGKGSGRMALAFEHVLGDRLDQGLVCVKYGHTEDLKKIELLQAAHPVPDEQGVVAAKRIAALLEQADEETLVINCISGGGSALLPMPLDSASTNNLVELTLAHKQETTKALLRCGADIREINCIRKHLSALKGGKLLKYIAPATSLNFILSDVIGDDLSTIASGITSPDLTTFQQCLDIIQRYSIEDQIPAVVISVLESGAEGEIAETVKPGDPVLDKCHNILLGTNRQALMASVEKAKDLGYTVRALTAQLTGEASSIAKVLADVAKDVACCDMLAPKPACIITGGEAVVTLTGEGKGGRNQEKALAFLEEMSHWTAFTDRVSFLSASTDGNDGPTDAAGAFADQDILRASSEKSMNIRTYLQNNDSYNFFDKTKGLLRTGPTNTNVCDLHIVLVV